MIIWEYNVEFSPQRGCYDLFFIGMCVTVFRLIFHLNKIGANCELTGKKIMLMFEEYRFNIFSIGIIFIADKTSHRLIAYSLFNYQ